jgi:hypothetical protein
MPSFHGHHDKKLLKARYQSRRAQVDKDLNPHGISTVKRNKTGTPKTTQETTIDQITLRQQTTCRSKKIKPSMPKMPWD